MAVAPMLAGSPQGDGQGHTDYQGRCLGHEKHGDSGCNICAEPCPCEPPCGMGGGF